MEEKENDKKTVVFAPLNWGLGHASRLVPLIRKYEQEHWKIILVSEGSALKFLKSEFPQHRIIDTQLPELQYSQKNNIGAHLFQLLPTFLNNKNKDSKIINQLVCHEPIHLIISDNRYGFRHSRVKSILLTHQLQLAVPLALKGLSFFAQKKLNQWINAFDECWIVDYENHDLAGKLSTSQRLTIPFQFLGLQSRLIKEDVPLEIDFLVVLSGLEPQRSILEQMLIKIFENSDDRLVFVGGHFNPSIENNKIHYLPFAETSTLNKLMNQSKVIIARSGFSTIMDLLRLNKKAVLIPTPGQTEQIYLAHFHSKNPQFSIAENDIGSIQRKIEMMRKY